MKGCNITKYDKKKVKLDNIILFRIEVQYNNFMTKKTSFMKPFYRTMRII